MVAFGVIIPVLPQLIVTLEGGDTQSAAGVFGIFGTAFAFMQFLSAPFLGALADRFGRRPVILLSNLGLGADYVVMALAPTIPILFVGRLISGITSSSFSTAGAYVADVTPPEKRAARFGMLGVAFGIGFIIGPALGGFLASVDLRAPFWAAAVLSFANFLYGLLILPESLPRERRGRFSPKAANPIGALRFLGGHRGLVGLAGAAFFAYLAHDSLPVTFVLYAAHRFAFDERSIGLALALAGVSSLIVQGGVIGRVVAALGEYRALLTGLFIGLLGQLLLGLAPTAPLFLAGIPVWSLFGLATPSLQAIASRSVGPTEQGQLQGALASLRSVATLITPVLYTQAFAAAIGPLAGLGLPGAAFLLSACLLFVSAVIVLRAMPERATQTAGQRAI
ncbi:MAG: TCR/Tet family MFS transporter [Chloroflexi bacterium]|nr:MAG: TCR/Tet family MFS transporter [Chloroflexota bacterium]